MSVSKSVLCCIYFEIFFIAMSVMCESHSVYDQESLVLKRNHQESDKFLKCSFMFFNNTKNDQNLPELCGNQSVSGNGKCSEDLKIGLRSTEGSVGKNGCKVELEYKGERSRKNMEPSRGLLRLLQTCLLRLECYRRKILRALDRVVEVNNLKLAEGVFLVKEYPEQPEERLESGVRGPEQFPVAVARRLFKILETHALRVRLGVMKNTVTRARRFHRGYRHAFPLMVGSFMLLAAFTVPFGFQLLAVVGGKALILSQIALFLAMGGHLQRYFGGGAAPPVGGYVQHDYYLRNDLRPWHREGEGVVVEVPHQQQQQHISHQQLLGYMNNPRIRP